MKRTYLIIFSLIFIFPLYGRDPDIPLKMDVTLPSVVYFSKADSLSKMLLYPYIYSDTMNKLSIETEPYPFNKFFSSLSVYRNNFSYNVFYLFRNDSLLYPLIKNSIGFRVYNVPDNDFLFSVYYDNKSVGEKHNFLLNFNIFKSISSEKFTVLTDIDQTIENKRTSGIERMLTTSSQFDYKFKNSHGIFFHFKSFNNCIVPALGYLNKRELYHTIYLGAKLIDKKPFPYASIKFYFYKGSISLFYNPTYEIRNFYDFADSIPDVFLPKVIYLHNVKHYSGFNLKFMGINLYSSYGDYRNVPYFDTLTNSIMINDSIRLIKSGFNLAYEKMHISFSFNLLNNFAYGDSLIVPDFSSSLHFCLKNDNVAYVLEASSDFDYIKNYKFVPFTLLTKSSIGIRLSPEFILQIYGEYNPRYKIYGEFYSLPAYKYGILIDLNQTGF
ncbi:MAG: hypothetical protein GWP03_02720 [Proteobacteria bacterium]|nr:hypothetical protein [Pseudomonadota bacterium]